MTDLKSSCAQAQMLIRKPVAEVFEAFINPSITSNFWFTKASAKLEVNKEVIWEWEMYKVSATVIAEEILPNEKIIYKWNNPETTVEFSFKSLTDNSTYVIVTEGGFNKTGEELIAAVRGSTGGFTTVLDGCKAFLEHGINLNLIADKFPKEIAEKK